MSRSELKPRRCGFESHRPDHPSVAQLAGGDRLKPCTVWVRIPPLGPFWRDTRELGFPLRCQRSKRRVRIPCVPPEWARRPMGRSLACTQGMRVRLPPGPPFRRCLPKAGTSVLTRATPDRYRAAAPHSMLKDALRGDSCNGRHLAGGRLPRGASDCRTGVIPEPSRHLLLRAADRSDQGGLISRIQRGATPLPATTFPVPSASGSAPGLHPARSGFEPLGTDHLW